MKKKKQNGRAKRERQASRESHFDPKIHQLGRQGFGFQMKKGYVATDEELSGKNLPFKTEK